MTEIGDGRYMKKSAKGLPPLRISTLIKKHKISRIKLNKNYIRLISGEMIGNSNYIGTSLNGCIQEIIPKGIKSFQYLHEIFA